MKTIMTAAFALSLLAGSSALAQERHEEHGGGGPPGGGAPHGPPHGAAPQGQPHGEGRGPGGPPQGPHPGGGPEQHFDRGRPGPGPASAPGQPPHPDFDRGRPGPGFDQHGDRGRPGPGGPGFRPRPGGFLDNRHWSFSQRFHGPAFYYPRGYSYRYWGFGSFLPAVFLTQNYTLYNYWTYGLPAPPPGYHWIRNGPDALLVRFGDGYVLDAAYGLFY